MPNSKDLLDQLDKLQEKKNTLMQEYSSSKSMTNELYKIRKNYGVWVRKWRDNHLLIILMSF